MNNNKVLRDSDLMALRDETHDFAKCYLRVAAAESDLTGEIPKAILQNEMADVLSKAYVPLRYGGGIKIPGSNERVECSSQISILLTEELAWGDPGITCGLPGPSLTFPVLLAHGSEIQKEKYLGCFSKRPNVWGAFATTENGAGTDTSGIKTRAVKTNGGYILNGTKCFITNGARADFVIVFATLDPSLKQFGHRAFIVEKNTSGFSVGSTEKMMGLRAGCISEIVLNDCFVPEENVLKGPNGKAYEAGIRGPSAAWGFFRTEVSAISVGIARAIYDELRENYGIDDQNLKREVEIGRRLCRNAACLHDSGQPADYAVSIAKAFTAQLSMRVCVKGIELVGAESLVEGHLFERLYRAAKAFNILEGSGEIQREHICSHLKLN